MAKSTGAPRRGRAEVSIEDVATAARVSPTTVSHALNGKGRVSAATRRHVEAVARRLGYTGNVHARRLRTGRNMAIAFQIAGIGRDGGFLHSAYAIELLNGAALAAMDRRYSLLLVPPTLGPRDAHQLRADGAIIIDAPSPTALYEAAVARALPIVTAGRIAGLEGDAAAGLWVDNDHRQSARKLLDHLTRRGYRRPAVLTTDAGFSYERDVLDEYRAWSDRRGIRPAVARVRLHRSSVEAALRRLLDEAGIDAVLATHEWLAANVLRAAFGLRRRVPADLGIASLADSARLAEAAVAVTALDLSPRRIGQEAVALLVAALAREQPPAAPIRVPTRLIARASTARTAS